MKSRDLGGLNYVQGWDDEIKSVMTYWLAIKLCYARAIKDESWRGIACVFVELTGKGERYNQLYGVSVMEIAARKLFLKSHTSRLLN